MAFDVKQRNKVEESAINALFMATTGNYSEPEIRKFDNITKTAVWNLSEGGVSEAAAEKLTYINDMLS